MQLVNRAAVNDLAAAVRAVAGRADLEVRGGRTGFPEALYAKIARLPGVALASPVIDLHAGVAGTEHTLRVLGVDVLRAARGLQVRPTPEGENVVIIPGAGGSGVLLSDACVDNGLSLMTIVIGHATFCIVVVYNNMLARLRRVSGSMYEAAADLGAHGLFTFRTVTFPMLSTALVSGALLAFALSFDEVIVTTFTAGAQNTLPLWIFGAIRLGQQLPEVNVVVTFVLLLTLIPVAIAARLTGGGGMTRASAGAAGRGGRSGGGPGDVAGVVMGGDPEGSADALALGGNEP